MSTWHKLAPLVYRSPHGSCIELFFSFMIYTRTFGLGFYLCSFKDFNNNNNSGFLYIAQVRHAVTLVALQHYYPWSLGLKSFLKPSQLPGEYTACVAKYVAQSRLTGTHLPVGGLKQLQWSVLLRDTSVTTGIRTHTLLNRITRAWIRCSYPLGHDTPHF